MVNKQPPKRIVIVGRPNVGKSTLFNRLLGRRRALVHDMPGVTRDRIEEKAQFWVKGKSMPVVLIDTGGLLGDRFAEEIEHQVATALDRADAVIFLFDGQTGVTPSDRELVQRFKKAGLHKKAAWLGIVNKIDAEVHEPMIADFYSLGVDPLMTISAEHNRGMDDLTDKIAELTGWVPEAGAAEGEEIDEGQNAEIDAAEKAQSEAEEDAAFERRIPRIAIVGRPNAGKSTLTNALLGEQRMITSPIAGTTVDSVDSLVEMDGKQFILVDTAGIRRKSKTEQGVEVLSVVQARKALEHADLAILMLDGETGITDQDEKIGGLIEEAGCAVILAVNKWDTQSKNQEFTRKDASELIRDEMGFLKYAPIVFISAKFKKGLKELPELIEEILHQKRLKIPTHEFSEWVRREAIIHNPMNARFYMCHQSGRHPPTFVCHVNDPKKIDFSLERHLINRMREKWGFMGSPIRMVFVGE